MKFLAKLQMITGKFHYPLINPLLRLRLDRQMVGGEDCLSAESVSSAADTQMRGALVLFLAEG